MNIRELMKEYSSIKISQGAADEYEDQIRAAIDHNMCDIDEMVKRDGRKIVKADDVVKYFGFLTSRTGGVLEGPQ